MATNAQALILAAAANGYGKLSARDLRECILAAASSGGSGGGVTQISVGSGLTVDPSGGTGSVSLALASFTSPQFTLSQVLWSAAHGLGSVPSQVRLVIVCVSNDAMSGFSAGQEVESSSFYDANDNILEWTFGADATNVFARAGAQPVGNEANIFMVTPLGGGSNTVTNWNNFRLKFYAKP